MKRILLVILLLGLAVLTVPPLRERAQPHLDRVGAWAAEGPLSPVINRYRRLKTESEISKAHRELVGMRNMGFQLPPPSEFRGFMVKHEFSPEGMDAWGTPYLLLPRGDSVAIISGGPDLEYHTPDDITQSLQYRYPQARRP